jgi:hypothetical protein
MQLKHNCSKERKKESMFRIQIILQVTRKCGLSWNIKDNGGAQNTNQ